MPKKIIYALLAAFMCLLGSYVLTAQTMDFSQLTKTVIEKSHRYRKATGFYQNIYDKSFVYLDEDGNVYRVTAIKVTEPNNQTSQVQEKRTKYPPYW